MIYEKYAKNGILTKTDMSQYNRLNSLEAEIIKVLKPVLKDSWKLIEQERERIYDEAFFRYMWDLEQTGEFSFNYGLFNRDTIKATIEKKDMIENPMDRITKKRLLENGILKVQSTLTQGLIQGIPYNRMAKDIRDSINGNFNDALRIIRTEGQRAQVLGQQAIYDKAEAEGIEGKWIWDAALDDRTRESHQALDGVERGEDGYFTFLAGPNKGAKTIEPLQSGIASEDINCRCRLRFEVAGIKPDARIMTDDDGQPINIKNMKYDEWLEWKQKPAKEREKDVIRRL